MGTQSAPMEMAATLQPGAAVVTNDGLRFATVKGVRGGYFELQLAQEGDFWLSASYIASAESGGVHLTISRAEVDQHRLSQPGIQRHDAQAPTGDAVLSSDEALAQRERMERELEAQRQRMGSSSDSGVIGTADGSPGEEGLSEEAEEAIAEISRERGYDDAIRERDQRGNFNYNE